MRIGRAEIEANPDGIALGGAVLEALAMAGQVTRAKVAAEEASQDPEAAREDGNAPHMQWQVRSAFSPGTRATLNVSIFHVGRIEQFPVDAYTRADVSAEWRFTGRLSAMAIAQNLFDAAHAESAGVRSLLVVTQVPRSAGLRLRVAFP